MRQARTGRSGRPSRSAGSVGGGGGGGGGGTPTLVGVTTYNGVSSITGFQLGPLPAGSAAGDFCVIGHATNFGNDTPAISGGVVAVSGKSGNPATDIYCKVLDSTDISNDYVTLNLRAARGGFVMAVFTGGTATPTPEDSGFTVTGSFPGAAAMPTPTSSNTILFIVCGNTNTSGRQTTIDPIGDLTLVGAIYFGTANDAYTTAYWYHNTTGLSIGAQQVVATGGPEITSAAEFTFV